MREAGKIQKAIWETLFTRNGGKLVFMKYENTLTIKKKSKYQLWVQRRLDDPHNDARKKQGRR